MRRLWRKGGKFCFSRRTSVRWAEAMFHELDMVVENLPAVLLHLPENITDEAHLGRREKTHGLFNALSHPPPFQVHGGLFLQCFCSGMCHKQQCSSAQDRTSRRRLGFDEHDVHAALAHHVSCDPREWEESLGVEVGSSLIKGSRMKFLRSPIEDVKKRFNGTQWDGSAIVEDWGEASSCSCESGSKGMRLRWKMVVCLGSSYHGTMATWHHADTLSMTDRGVLNDGIPLDKTPVKTLDKYFECANPCETRSRRRFKSQDAMSDLGCAKEVCCLVLEHTRMCTPSLWC